ncbi:hypothetical protein [Acaryochloris sp. CCMEE 5410]|uniref:hypothetical protein n=1 Tax=Acaryochloris sp. CCMEE 5410 TaxID=310037 RepID=UPI0002484018|nr:hypothetical protein [Acaryochloris sp. CCMEE 5410]KAI9134597.1 hypothetical protein ON05_015830 [Acaryochloris sp. CCMEE 5410]
MESSEQPTLENMAGQSEQTATNFDTEFPAALTEAENTLQQIRDRYLEITTAQAEKAQLEKKLAAVQTDRSAKAQTEQDLAALQTELEQIQDQIQTLGMTLESQLWKWHDLKEPFWQFIRYFGLGFAAAVVIHKFAG